MDHNRPWEKQTISSPSPVSSTHEAGGSADVVLWSGDPLEVRPLADGVWIGGLEVPLVSRQTELREKYRPSVEPAGE